MVRKLNLFFLIMVLLCAATLASADNAVPAFLPFQGRATDAGGNAITVPTVVNFRIYPPTGTCYLYEDTQTVTPNAENPAEGVRGSSLNRFLKL